MVIAFAVVFCVDSLTWLPLLNGGLEAAAAATMRFCSRFNERKMACGMRYLQHIHSWKRRSRDTRLEAVFERVAEHL